MVYVESRIEDAMVLWRAGREDGAFLLAIIAVISRARQELPNSMGDGERFRRYVESRFAPRISVEYRGRLWPIEQIFYKWFRCEIVHAGGLPIDIELMTDAAADELRVRAGGAPDYKLLVSPAWFHQLVAWAQT
jgi:hypothetical protein